MRVPKDKLIWDDVIRNERLKVWAYKKLYSGEALFAGDRQRDGYPVVAEIHLDNETVRKQVFSNEVKVRPVVQAVITIYHKDREPIDTPNWKYPIDDLIFEIEVFDKGRAL